MYCNNIIPPCLELWGCHTSRGRRQQNVGLLAPLACREPNVPTPACGELVHRRCCRPRSRSAAASYRGLLLGGSGCLRLRFLAGDDDELLCSARTVLKNLENAKGSNHVNQKLIQLQHAVGTWRLVRREIEDLSERNMGGSTGNVWSTTYA